MMVKATDDAGGLAQEEAAEEKGKKEKKKTGRRGRKKEKKDSPKSQLKFGKNLFWSPKFSKLQSNFFFYI